MREEFVNDLKELLEDDTINMTSFETFEKDIMRMFICLEDELITDLENIYNELRVE